MKQKHQTAFDWNTAKEMTDSFAFTSGIHCRLYGSEGELLYEQGELADGCAFCRKLTELTGRRVRCERIHQHGALEAKRFGGRYIYFCPSGMAYFSSPIITGGAVSGALVGGPVLIMEEDEIISDALAGTGVTADGNDQLRHALATIPRMEPSRLNHLSAQLFAGAVYVSDNTHELFLVQRGNKQQDTIGAYIQQFKSDKLAKLYPVETEHDLVDAITNGNRDTSEQLLNELLGYLFFSSADENTLHSRMTELLVVMARAALYCGTNGEQVFEICHKGMRQLQRLSAKEDMAKLLTNSLDQLIELVYHLMDTKHKNIIHRSIDYMRRNCGQKLTLQEVAQYAGYSPSYFSKLFRTELGCTFQTFLNQLRVDKSKALLLSTTISSAEISGLVGFEDQSYFCKVFKQFNGVTPDQYRKRKRRIDAARERDTKQKNA